MSTPVLQVKNLYKHYGGKQAVAGLDLTVHAGEIVAVLGPNGAGKTTTVEICEGFRHRDSGTVEVLGEDPQTAGRQWRARIGIVLQTANDMAEATVEEIVRHFATFYPNPRPADELIAAVGLTQKRRDRVRALSGGQRRRLDVALGIVGRPELLFLDEPTTGFDPQARRDFWDLIEGLRQDGTAILLTTHYLEEAERLADRIVVINNGQIVAEGTIAELSEASSTTATVRWENNGQTQEQRTDSPTKMITELQTEFGGGEVPGLTVTRPSLEDLYLDLIRDQRTEKP